MPKCNCFAITIFWSEFNYLITSTLFYIHFSRQTNTIILKEKTGKNQLKKYWTWLENAGKVTATTKIGTARTATKTTWRNRSRIDIYGLQDNAIGQLLLDQSLRAIWNYHYLLFFLPVMYSWCFKSFWEVSETTLCL